MAAQVSGVSGGTRNPGTIDSKESCNHQPMCALCAAQPARQRASAPPPAILQFGVDSNMHPTIQPTTPTLTTLAADATRPGAPGSLASCCTASSFAAARTCDLPSARLVGSRSLKATGVGACGESASRGREQATLTHLHILSVTHHPSHRPPVGVIHRKP